MKRLGKSFKYLILPVPVVFLRMAFCPHWSEIGKYRSAKHILHANLISTPLTAANLSTRVAARSAGSLLFVHRDLTASAAARVGLGVSFTETSGTLGLWNKLKGI